MTLASLRGCMVARHPRHGAVDHDHHVGLRQERAGIVAEMHGMIGRQVHVARLGLHHRQARIRSASAASAPTAAGTRPTARGHDQRELGLGDERRRLLDRGARGFRRQRAERAHGVAARHRSRARSAPRAAASDRPARAARSWRCRGRGRPPRRPAGRRAARSPISRIRAACRPGRTPPGPSGSAGCARRCCRSRSAACARRRAAPECCRARH